MPIAKSEIIAHIKRLAKADGATPGRQRFEAATGIKRLDWYGRYWAKWGDALQEAGLTANDLQGEFEKETVLEAYVALIEKLGRVPTEGDIRLARRSDVAFPSHSTLAKHLGLKKNRLSLALSFAKETNKSELVQHQILNAIEALPPEEENSNETDIDVKGELIFGFVYLIKSGKYYKIGKTNSIDRRKYEIGLHLAEGIEPIHSIETDDPSGIEAYWHNRFKAKRMNGEWFNLDSSDIRAFRLRKKFM